jgi:bifunctional UDP-N-acetylglucosamine pyrophosphorylase/glucosamine-1-phosphate N-acetyltransferase
MPLLTCKSVIRLTKAHSLSHPAVTVLTLADDDPMGRERANHGVDGTLVEIAERREDAPEGQDTRVHCGACCLDGNWLWSHIGQLSRSPVGREDILADVIRMALSEGQRVQTILADDPDEMLRIEDRTHLARAEAVIRRRINEQLMLKGVTLQDPASTYIDATVTIGSDTVILANTHLAGQTTIGQECVIGPNSIIRDSHIGDRCRVTASVVEEAVMEEDCDIGPFGHIRPKARMCAGSHMGNFGEIKNATLGPGVKMGHFGYLGDATIGEGANIGAGTITCNYDGERKHPTTIGKNAFLGAGSILIAPVIIGDESRTGAGAVVTRDVPPNTLVYGVPARPAPPKKEDKEQ